MASKCQDEVESWRQTVPSAWLTDDILFAHHSLDTQHPLGVFQGLEFYEDNSDSLTSDVKFDESDLQYSRDGVIRFDTSLPKLPNQTPGGLATLPPLTVLVPAPSTPPASSIDPSQKTDSPPSTKASRLGRFPEIPSLKSAINAKLSEISELRKLHRRAQNRNAQRAFRERKDQALRENAVQLESLHAMIEKKDVVIKESEKKVQLLQEDISRLQGTVRRLEQAIMRLMCERNGEAAVAAAEREFIKVHSTDSGGELREFEASMKVSSP